MATAKVKKSKSNAYVPARTRVALSPGDAVRVAREIQEMTHADLAAATGIAQPTLSSIEGGRVTLGAERAEKLARALKVTPRRAALAELGRRRRGEAKRVSQSSLPRLLHGLPNRRSRGRALTPCFVDRSQWSRGLLGSHHPASAQSGGHSTILKWTGSEMISVERCRALGGESGTFRFRS
jgi:transcriptional regulator with XRE-family HTH domain